MKRITHRALIGVALAAAGAIAWAQPADRGAHGRDPGHVMVTPKDLQWKDGPDSLPAGAKIAVLEGDLASAGPFTVRLKLPARYEIPAHTHPQIEHVTVVSGEFSMGTGGKLDRSKATALPAGGFAVMQIGTQHFAFTGNEETVVQVHGVGPWGIIYVDPATDPRIKGKK